MKKDSLYHLGEERKEIWKFRVTPRLILQNNWEEKDYPGLHREDVRETY